MSVPDLQTWIATAETWRSRFVSMQDERDQLAAQVKVAQKALRTISESLCDAVWYRLTAKAALSTSPSTALAAVDCLKWKRAFEEATAQVEVMWEALRQYGRCDSDCPCYDDAGKHSDSDCTCGFLTALPTPPPAALARIQAEAEAKALKDAAQDMRRNKQNLGEQWAQWLEARAKSLSYMSEVRPKVEPNESSSK